MTASRSRFVLVAIGLLAGLGSLMVLAAGLAASTREATNESSNLSGTLVAPLAVINPAYARQRALAAVPRSGLQSGSQPSTAEVEQAQAAISGLLALSPSDSELWVMQARLLASLRGEDQRIAEMLKMAYLTAPGNFTLMPSRLEIAVTTNAVSDPVLEVLAEGDVRAILLKRLDLSDKLLATYQRATEPGKAFLMRTAAGDTQFAARLAASGQ